MIEPGQLVAYCWSPRVEALVGSAIDQFPLAEPARVVKVDRDRAHVVTANAAGTARARPLPAVGDWVLVERDPDAEVPYSVSHILDRWSEIIRQDPVSEGQDEITTQSVAANVDIMVLVEPFDRGPNDRRLDRGIVLAYDAGARPVVVLTKSDLAEDAALTERLLAERHPGIEVIVTSSRLGDGVEALRALSAPDRTLAFVGPSGAGKSTLANALVGESVMLTGDVREGDNRGRHTTTSRNMLPIPGGGVLIDTPGIRSLALVASDAAVEEAFDDIAEIGMACRFRDCSHRTEPGCAVREAVELGQLSRARLDSFEKLSDEMAYLARRESPKAAAEQERKWRTVHKAVRDLPKKGPR